MRVEDRRFLGQVLRFAAALSSMFIGYGLIQPLISLYASGFVGTSYLLVGALMSTIGLVKAGMGPVSGSSRTPTGGRGSPLSAHSRSPSLW